MSNELKTLLDEYNSIDQSEVAVFINGKEYIDTEHKKRISELEDKILDCTANIMRLQQKLAKKYKVEPIHDVWNINTDYKLDDISDKGISIKLWDRYYDSCEYDYDYIEFKDIIDFDENGYKKQCIQLRIKNLEHSLKHLEERKVLTNVEIENLTKELGSM